MDESHQAGIPLAQQMKSTDQLARHYVPRLWEGYLQYNLRFIFELILTASVYLAIFDGGVFTSLFGTVVVEVGVIRFVAMVCRSLRGAPQSSGLSPAGCIPG